MLVFLKEQLAILQILVLFIGVILSTISFNSSIARIVSIFSIFINILFSLVGIIFIKFPHYLERYFETYSKEHFQEYFHYNFGNFATPFGIEYKIGIIEISSILFLNLVIFFLLIYGKSFISKILQDQKKERRHLFYSILLVMHLGNIGILSTNDIFNIYVFLEIMSLATYILISSSVNIIAIYNSFDYLVIGTIGASFILIAIYFLFSLTGSLNIDHIKIILDSLIMNKSTNIIISSAFIFLIIGSFIKLGVFPFNFHVIKTYFTTYSVILIYVAISSTILSIMIFYKIFNSFINIENIYLQKSLEDILLFISSYPLTVILIICSIIAYASNNLKKILIYSSAMQITYIILLFLLVILFSKDNHANNQDSFLDILLNNNFFFFFIIFDALNKILFFTIFAILEKQDPEIFIENKSMKICKLVRDQKMIFKIIIVIAILFNGGLPLTPMFFIKIDILKFMLDNQQYQIFFGILIASIFSILYSIKIGYLLLLNNKESIREIKEKSFKNIISFKEVSGLILIILIEFTLMCV